MRAKVVAAIPLFLVHRMYLSAIMGIVFISAEHVTK